MADEVCDSVFAAFRLSSSLILASNNVLVFVAVFDFSASIFFSTSTSMSLVELVGFATIELSAVADAPRGIEDTVEKSWKLSELSDDMAVTEDSMSEFFLNHQSSHTRKGAARAHSY